MRSPKSAAFLLLNSVLSPSAMGRGGGGAGRAGGARGRSNGVSAASASCWCTETRSSVASTALRTRRCPTRSLSGTVGSFGHPPCHVGGNRRPSTMMVPLVRGSCLRMLSSSTTPTAILRGGGDAMNGFGGDAHNNDSIARKKAFASSTAREKAFASSTAAAVATGLAMVASTSLRSGAECEDENNIGADSERRVNGEAAGAAAQSSSDDVVATTTATQVEETALAVDTAFPEECLRHDTYNGVTIDVQKVPVSVSSDPQTFGKELGRALTLWSKQDKRGIWIRVPTDYSHLIPPSTDLGFDFQFAERGSVVLTRWLPTEMESRLPHGPTHQVGIGAVVLHPRTGKMLVVQEKSGPAAARKLWKMPTGLTDPGEDIADAAVRELLEETGLHCTFDRIICFRQSHGGLFNRSDMFFVCLLRLAPEYEEALERGEDVALQPQEEEILDAKWTDMEEYASQELWLASPLYTEMHEAMMRAARDGIEYGDGSGRHGGGDVSRVLKEEEEDGTVGDETGGQGVGGVPSMTRRSHHSEGGGTATGTDRGGGGSGGGGFVGKKLPVGFRPGTNTIYVSKL